MFLVFYMFFHSDYHVVLSLFFCPGCNAHVELINGDPPFKVNKVNKV